MADSDFNRGDIQWVEHPIVTVREKKKGDRRPKNTFRSRIPRILRELAPNSVFDPHVVWRNQRIADGSVVVIEARSERDLSIIRANNRKREEDNYKLDAERIATKVREGGIPALLSVRGLMLSNRGRLELMLEILRLAAAKKRSLVGSNEMTDVVVAMDVMWALRDYSLFNESMAELEPAQAPVVVEEQPASTADSVKELMKSIKKMNIGELNKECVNRKISMEGTKQKKEDLIALIRKHIESGAGAAPAPPPVAAPAPPALSPEAVMVAKYRDIISKVEIMMIDHPDIIVFQLTLMAHLLPPLSPFYQQWKLDDWQIRALRYIDDNKSVLICAPTSSGKTVISSYVASMFISNAAAAQARAAGGEEESSDDDEDQGRPGAEDARILFVVPTEPLVWQVAAHFSKFVGKDAKVALVTEQMSYTPNSARIVVGTPAALESAMTKIRGKNSSILESKGMVDATLLNPGFHNYRWVVYDEVHSLNSETSDGAALQRLIRLVNCPFLCLSATVGNSEMLRSWLEDIRGDQRGIEIVEAPPDEGWERAVFDVGGQRALDEAESKRLVKKIVHEGRFINLQRHVWAKSRSEGRSDHLEPLSPLSAVSTSFLLEGGFNKCSLPMTPLDAYHAWLRLEGHFPLAEVEELRPRTFFAYKFHRPDRIPSRLTLAEAKTYEAAIKAKLQTLVLTHRVEMESMLSTFVVPESSTDFDSIPPTPATNTAPASYGDLTDLIWKLKGTEGNSDMLPALVFHLDMFQLVERFKSLLGGLELMQKTLHPRFHKDLQDKQKIVLQEMQSDLNEAVGDREKEMVRQIYAPRLAAVDVEQPHNDFVLSHRISIDEIKNIVDEMKADKLTTGTAISSHALIRGLRRGFAIVLNHASFQAYRRNVLRLALQGKLAVVFSDVSLAYGVNMPFRTCVFCGDMGGQLDALMLQQMSGRAGRRGLDTQGHLIYAGTSPTLINNLTLGVIPAITGVEYRYHTQNLMYYLSGNVPIRTNRILSRPSLKDFMTPDAPRYDFDEISRQTLLALNLVMSCPVWVPSKKDDEFEYSLANFDVEASVALSTPSGIRPNGRKTVVLWMVWELRTCLPESILAALCLPLFYSLIADKPDYGHDEEDQFEFMVLLLLLINRRPCGPGKEPLLQHKWVTAENNKRREDMRQLIDVFIDRLTKIRDDKFQNLPRSDMLMFPLSGDFNSGPCSAPLDGTLFAAFYAGNANFVASNDLQPLMESIWHVGTTLVKMNNAIWPDGIRYGKLRFVIAKCHSRLNYLNREILTAHMNLPNCTLPELEGK